MGNQSGINQNMNEMNEQTCWAVCRRLRLFFARLHLRIKLDINRRQQGKGSGFFIPFPCFCILFIDSKQVKVFICSLSFLSLVSLLLLLLFHSMAQTNFYSFELIIILSFVSFTIHECLSIPVVCIAYIHTSHRNSRDAQRKFISLPLLSSFNDNTLFNERKSQIILKRRIPMSRSETLNLY